MDSVWRRLDLGAWRLEVRARLRRLCCPTHGVRTEGVPFARGHAPQAAIVYDPFHVVSLATKALDEVRREA